MRAIIAQHAFKFLAPEKWRRMSSCPLRWVDRSSCCLAAEVHESIGRAVTIVIRQFFCTFGALQFPVASRSPWQQIHSRITARCALSSDVAQPAVKRAAETGLLGLSAANSRHSCGGLLPVCTDLFTCRDAKEPLSTARLSHSSINNTFHALFTAY